MNRLLASLLLLVAFTNVQCGVVVIINSEDWRTNDFERSNSFERFYAPFRPKDDLPDPKDVARMARYIVHEANWTSVAYISNQQATKGQALAAIFAVSDGPVEKGSGVPYFYVSRLQSAVDDLLDADNRCSLMMSLAQTPICSNNDWDPEDPRCAHIIITGTFHQINNDSAEYPTASDAVFKRHPGFIGLPENHHFFIAKLNIETISIQDEFGGPASVPVNDYFDVNDGRLGLYSYYPRKRYYLVNV